MEDERLWMRDISGSSATESEEGNVARVWVNRHGDDFYSAEIVARLSDQDQRLRASGPNSAQAGGEFPAQA